MIFMVGGVTFEESQTVFDFNKNNPNMRVILGGTSVLNTTGFMMEMEKMN